LGVADQAALSGTNFVANVLLVRWMSAADYGSFAVAFACLIILSGPYVALAVEPVNIVGTRRFLTDQKGYIKALLILHVVLMAGVGAVMGAPSLLPEAWRHFPAKWFVALALATPAVLFLWLVRAASYLLGQVSVALFGSVVYMVSMAILIPLAHVRGLLTPESAMVVMGISSVIGSAAVLARLGWAKERWRTPSLSDVAREHWTYGRWLLGSAMAHSVAYGLFTPLVSRFGRLEDAGAFKALQNLALPLERTLTGITATTYPAIARRVATDGASYVVHVAVRYVALASTIAIVYGAMLVTAGSALMRLLYGDSGFSDYANLLWMLAIAGVGGAVAQSLGILVRSANKPATVMWSKIAAATWTLGVGVFLVAHFSIRGAIAASAGAAIVESFVLAAGCYGLRARSQKA
jgi:O-antigen/teichoic acid export membrane protein